MKFSQILLLIYCVMTADCTRKWTTITVSRAEVNNITLQTEIIFTITDIICAMQAAKRPWSYLYCYEGMQCLISSLRTARLQDPSIQDPVQCMRGCPDFLQNVAGCVTYMSASLTWDDARQYCRNQGTDLATLDYLEGVAAIQAFLQALGPPLYQDIWVGAHKSSGSNYAWISGAQSTISASLWASGEPFGTVDCVQIWNAANGLDDASCSGVQLFLCDF